MAIKGIKKGINEIDTFMETRKQEKLLAEKLLTDKNRYDLAMNNEQKNHFMKSMKESMDIINKEYPKFQKHYPATFKDSKEVINKHDASLEIGKQNANALKTEMSRTL